MGEPTQIKQVLNLNVPYQSDLYVAGNISAGGSFITDSITTNGLIIHGDLGVDGVTVSTGNIVAGSDVYVYGNLDVLTNSTTEGNSYVKGDSYVTGNVHTSGYNSSSMIGFKVHNTGNFHFTNTDTSIFYGSSVGGNTWNSYDNNPFSANGSGWKSNIGVYQIPIDGYYKFEMTTRATDSEANAGFIPLRYDTTKNYMIENTDHTIWIPEDNTTRRMATYATCVYANSGDWIYATPYTTNYWNYVEFSGRFVGV